MRNFIVGLSILTFLAGSAQEASAAFITSKSITMGGGASGTTNFPDTSVRFRFAFQPTLGQFGDPPTPLFDLQLNTASAGQSFIADSSTANFTVNVANITDGLNGWQVQSLMNSRGGGANGRTEALYFHNDATGASGIDLQGYRIDRIVLHLDTATFVNQGTSLSYSFSGTVTFEGESLSAVPAPPGIVLLVTGAVSMLVCGWCRITRAQSDAEPGAAADRGR